MSGAGISGLLLVLLVSRAELQQIAPVQVLKISAGPSGSERNGVFTLSEERSVFSRSTDREVIVFFQWENVPGPHKLVAQWRSPDGGTTASSAIDYNATDKRFGAYWSFPLTPSMPLGTWSIDATMDGRPAGRFTFEITDAKVEAAATKRPLTEAEIYARLNHMFVVLRRTSADGRELDAAAGFVAAPQSAHIYTVMPAVDGTETLRAVTGDGTAHELTRLIAWDRRQQWAVLQARASTGDRHPVAAYEKVTVGSRCFSMEGTTAGIRVLVAGTISGMATTSSRPVLIATFPRAFGMPGAPVLDEYGHILGIVGGGMPGDPRPIEHVVAARGSLNGAPVIPFAAVNVPPAAPGFELAALRAAGDVMPPVVGGSQTVAGGFARGGTKGNEPVSELLEEFPLREKTIALVLTWTPPARLRGQAVVRLFDADNTAIVSSPPRRVDFRQGNQARSRWDLPALQAPGIYRVDVLIDARTYWRGFVRINP